MSCCSKPQKEENHEHRHSGGCCSKPEPKHDHHHDHDHSHQHGGGCCSVPKKNVPSEINRQMTIEQIIQMFPSKAQKLKQEITNAGLHCVGCHAAVWETLEGGMRGHGKSEEEIDGLVKKLNKLLQEKVETDTITLTSRGASKFLEILAEENKQGWGMRFSEEMAGCSGFEYVLDFSEKSLPDDQIFSSEGVEIHVKKAMVPRLLGSEIDYVDGLRGSGFKITNPNVKAACGCGSSHNY